MIGLSRGRLAVMAVIVIVLAGLVLLDRASYRCMLTGGHFEVSRWTCRPRPPIILQRDLEHS